MNNAVAFKIIALLTWWYAGFGHGPAAVILVEIVVENVAVLVPVLAVA